MSVTLHPMLAPGFDYQRLPDRLPDSLMWGNRRYGLLLPIVPQPQPPRISPCLQPSEPPSGGFRCSYCNRVCSSKSTLETHQRVHTGERPHQCRYCGKRFADKSNMVTHLRIHTGERPFVCRLCGKAYKQKGHLNSHMQSHRRSVQRQAAAVASVQTQPQPYQLSPRRPRAHTYERLQHRRRASPVSRPYLCPHCGVSFSQLPNLNVHILQRHHTVFEQSLLFQQPTDAGPQCSFDINVTDIDDPTSTAADDQHSSVSTTSVSCIEDMRCNSV